MGLRYVAAPESYPAPASMHTHPRISEARCRTSTAPWHLALARKKFRVGNLYLNRSITGALVGRQPFGGFGLSGGGTKAGGADYLHHFTDPRALTENTLRHGFAPMPDGPQS